MATQPLSPAAPVVTLPDRLPPTPAMREQWEAAFDKWRAADEVAERDIATKGVENLDDATDRAVDLASDAEGRMLTTPAPAGAALLVKLERLLDPEYRIWNDRVVDSGLADAGRLPRDGDLCRMEPRAGRGGRSDYRGPPSQGRTGSRQGGNAELEALVAMFTAPAPDGAAFLYKLRAYAEHGADFHEGSAILAALTADTERLLGETD